MALNNNQKGFTLVELMLAMAFLSVLLLSIALVAVQSGRIYNRGIILSSINQAGRDISDTLRRDFLQANSQKVTNVIKLPDDANWTNARICLGSYSYVWNNPKYLDNPSLLGAGSMFKVDGKYINLVRVDDPDANLCRRSSSGSYANNQTSSKVSNLLKPIEEGGGSIGVHNLDVAKVSRDKSAENLYRITITLGTSRLSEIDRSSCKPPDEADSNLEFCSINKFDMIVRTNG